MFNLKLKLKTSWKKKIEFTNATVPMCSFLVLYVQIIFKSTTSIVDAYMQFKRNELAKSSWAIVISLDRIIPCLTASFCSLVLKLLWWKYLFRSLSKRLHKSRGMSQCIHILSAFQHKNRRRSIYFFMQCCKFD